MPRNTYGDTVKKRVKRLLEALLDFVNYDFEGNFDIEFKPETKDVTNPKVIFKTTLVALEQLIAKDKYPGKLKKEQIREALKLLENFLKILKDNRTKTQGSDDWHFTLTLWSKDREKNLKQFDNAWEDSRPEKSKTLVSNYQKSDEFDWRDICGKVLETQQLRRQATAQQYELNIYVPLGLMERPKTPNPKPYPTGEDSRLQKEPELQIVQTYKDDAFFQKVVAESRTDKAKHIAIIGEPGAGKTTLLEELAEQLPKNSSDFPICIRLADLRESTIKDYLVNNWLEKALEHIEPIPQSVTPEIIESLKQLFRQGKVWLLLDGVDEMAAESPVLALAKIREQLTDWVGKARVVLTCRLNVWDATISNTLTNFDTYKTLEFEPDDVDKFICQWFEQASQDEKRCNSGNETYWLEQGKHLQKQLKEAGKDNIRRMVRNPLRLSMLCQSWCVPEQDLPETKAGLYEQFTTYFFEWKQEEFQKKHRVLKKTEKKQIKQALAKLALAAMESTNRFRIEEEFAIEQMEEQWFDLAGELGWLVLVDRDTRTKKPVYAFLHSTFQEYFAALAVGDRYYFLPRNHVDFPVVGKEYRIFEALWKQVILLWLGREDVNKDNKQAFIKALLTFEDNCQGFYQLQAYFLAAAGIAEFNDFDEPDIINRIIDQLIVWWFFYPEFENQEWLMYSTYIEKAAAIALKETDRLKAINALTGLLQTLQHESERYRFRVAAFILDIDPKNSEVKATLTDLLNSRTYREAAASILCEKNLNEQEAKRIVDNQEKSPEEINQGFKLLKSLKEKQLQAINALETWNDVNYLISQLRDGFEIKQDGETSVKHNFTAAKARLAEIGRGDIIIIEAILQLLFTKPSAFLVRQIIGLFKEIINTNLLYFSVVNILSEYLDGNVIELSCDRYRCAIEILWYCSQNLPYPDFYQAWHQDTLTNSATASLNLANLPQLLAEAINDRPELRNKIKLICIDSDKFGNPENPATKIYNEMRLQGCDKIEDGKPKTMAELQDYWDELRIESEISLFLICYDSTALSATPTGFSEPFLKALSKFDRAICVACEPGDIPLQTFSPQQKDLVAAIVQWIEKVITEN